MSSLPPYEKDRPCPMCGEKGAETRYLPEHGGVLREHQCAKTRVEHLHRVCRNCGYGWCEALAVGPVNSEGLTPEQVG